MEETVISKGKGKVVPMHAVTASWGTGGMAPLVLNDVCRWWSVVTFKPTPLCPQINC